ncbi:hypothetical protein QFC22_005059 [Naganishia vaughanmartiniae]|uniref:Uncharacterized protein n=1 Tax=Naganishia vaughanmartiniae TaxID=1424756 RepID=A0ACC2WYP3_9TREE|nr:hypothetical protein QFC22_005059 [Naganishia vaughanmartiniae]
MYPVVASTQSVQLAPMSEGNCNMESYSTAGSQQRESQVMMAMNRNQATFESPVYMVQNGAPAQQLPSAGFLQHRQSITTDQQLRLPTQAGQHYQSIQQSGPSANHDIDVVQQRQHVPQYKVPYPIMTTSSFAQPQPDMYNYGYRINPSPTYMTQPSPIQQMSPYYMVQPSPNDVGQQISSTPNYGQTCFVIPQRDTSTVQQQGQPQQHQQGQQQPQQSNLPHDQGQMRFSQHVETPHTLTPLTSTFLQYMPFQSESPTTGKTDQSEQFYVQQQQQSQLQQFPVMHQQHVSPQSQGNGLQVPGTEPQMQTQYTMPCANPGQGFTYAVRRESSPAVVYPYQQAQPNRSQNMASSYSMHHKSERSTNPHPPDPGINSGPFSHSVHQRLRVSSASDYTTVHPSARDLASYPEGSHPTWSPYQQRMMGPQNANVHATFPASYRGNPAVNAELNMSADDGEEEEYTSTMVFDPYVVKHRKRTSPEQLAILEDAFEENQKPTADARKLIAEKIGMTPRSVQVWFQNRRQKRKSLAKKEAEGDPAETNETQALHSAYSTQNSSGMEPPVVNVVDPYNGQVSLQDEGWTRAQIPPRGVAHLRAAEANFTATDPSSSRRGSSSQQQSIAGVGAIKSTPFMGQARRGSLPYPPPAGSPNNATFSAKPLSASPGLVRTVSGSSVLRPQLPLRLAIALNNGRRASLPISSQTVSLGPFTPPRIGARSLNQSTLMAIADDEHLLHPMAGVTNGYLASHSALAHGSFANNSDESGDTTPEAKVENSEYGPLPHPGFSFGQATAATQNGSSTTTLFMPSHTQMPQLPPSATVYRDRMGSMASTMSHATTNDDASDSDWERAQQLVTPFMPSDGEQLTSFPGFAPDTSQEDVQVSIVNMRLKVPLGSEMRRASAPAELLKNFAVSDAERPQSQPGPKKSSNLYMSHTGNIEEHDERSNASATPSPQV